MWTYICLGFWAGVVFALTGYSLDDYVGRVCEAYCPKQLAVNRPPTVMVQPTDVIAAIFERPWWEGGSAPR